MLALEMQNIKQFMKALLLQDSFHSFLVEEASVTTFASFTIDGALHADFFDSEKTADESLSSRTLVLWQEIQPFLYSVIRGKNTPLSFQIIFHPDQKMLEHFLSVSDLNIFREDIYSLSINCRYQNKTLLLTTGASLRVFSPDKRLEHAWDAYVENFLKENRLD